MQSLWGIQKSITGMQSSTLRVRRTMVKRPIVTYTFLPFSVSTKISSNTRQMSSGTDDTSISPQQQQLLSAASTTLVARQMGSTTSVCDSFFLFSEQVCVGFGCRCGVKLWQVRGGCVNRFRTQEDYALCFP